jgi:hypothetical protein
MIRRCLKFKSIYVNEVDLTKCKFKVCEIGIKFIFHVPLKISTSFSIEWIDSTFTNDFRLNYKVSI